MRLQTGAALLRELERTVESLQVQLQGQSQSISYCPPFPNRHASLNPETDCRVDARNAARSDRTGADACNGKKNHRAAKNEWVPRRNLKQLALEKRRQGDDCEQSERDSHSRYGRHLHYEV